MLTYLSTLYHPPTTLAPLQVDADKKGKDSDHNIILMAPLSNASYAIKRNKKTIKVRPLPESQIIKFENEIINHDWSDVINCSNIDEKVSTFHLRLNFEQTFPLEIC